MLTHHVSNHTYSMCMLNPAVERSIPAWCHMLQAKRGGLRDTDAIELLSTVFKAVLQRTGVEAQVRVRSPVI